MDYTTAVALKEAGFPQEGFAPIEMYRDKTKDQGDGSLLQGHFVRKPTLEQLIEACGDRFRFLSQNKPGYWAARATWDMKLPPLDSIGPTPIEAVAALYLSLSKNK